MQYINGKGCGDCFKVAHKNVTSIYVRIKNYMGW